MHSCTALKYNFKVLVLKYIHFLLHYTYNFVLFKLNINISYWWLCRIRFSLPTYQGTTAPLCIIQYLKCNSICVGFAYFSMSVIYHFLPYCPITSHQKKKTDPHLRTHLLLLLMSQYPTAWYYCQANVRCLSPQMQSYLFIQTRALLTLGTWKASESRRERWHKRPQTPQMGFQSVLIYLSPWGLLSVCNMPLPWLTR